MLRFKVKSQKAVMGKNKGKTVYYAHQEMGGRMTLSAVEDAIIKRTSLAKGDVRNAIASLAEVVNEALLRGQIVDLGDLGSFKVTASGKHMSTEQEVDASTIKRPRIQHYPKAEMKQHAQRVALEVIREKEDKGGSSVPPSGGGGSQGSGGSSSSDQGL